jgi:hypothetical protein
MAHSKSGLPINGFAFFINQRLPLVVLIYKNIFKRLTVTGQVELDLELDSNNSTQVPEQITTGQYIYRSIATNLNQRLCHYYL